MSRFRVGVFCAFWPPKVYVQCSSPICSSVLTAGLFALRYLFPNYPFIKGSSIEPQTTQMSCSQDICSSLVLSSKDTLVSDNTSVCAFFWQQESFHSWDMCHSFGTCLPSLLQEQFCSFTHTCSRDMNLWLNIFWGLIRPFIQSGLSILGSSGGCLRLHIWNGSLCHEIQSQASLVCASCARSLASSNRCPGVLLSGLLFTPSLLQLFAH